MCTWTCLLCYQELGSLSSTGSGSLTVLKYIGTAIEGECLICLNFFFFSKVHGNFISASCTHLKSYQCLERLVTLCMKPESETNSL